VPPPHGPQQRWEVSAAMIENCPASSRPHLRAAGCQHLSLEESSSLSNSRLPAIACEKPNMVFKTSKNSGILTNLAAVTVQTAFILLLSFGMGTYIHTYIVNF
ncbi:unnamed protein product, partial [Tetraodon nigroviridis]